MRVLKSLRLKPLLLAILMVLTIGASLVSPFGSSKAYASAFDDASVDEQVSSYIYMRAIARCLDKSGLRDGLNLDRVDTDSANNYQWFAQASAQNQFNSTETYTGYLDTDDSTGVTSCWETDFIQAGAEIWGWSDPVTAICYSGFKRANQDDGANAEQCREGTGRFARDGGKSEAKDQFILNVNKQYYDKEGSKAWPAMTDAMKYWYYSQSFLKLCDASERSGSYTQAQVDADDHLYRMLGEDGSTYTVYESGDKDKGSSVTTRTDDDLSEVKKTCGELVTLANQFAPAYAAAIAADPEKGDPSVDGEVGLGAIDTSCGGFDSGGVFGLSVGTAIRWIACPLVEGFSAAARVLDSAIMDMLCVDESQIFGGPNTCNHEESGSLKTANAYKDAWNVFRIIALGFLAIAGLVMILSQTMGLEIVDAYTIKKVLPRLLVAAIAVSLSWELMQFFVSLTNVLGTGIRGLIYAPFAHADIDTVTLGGGGSAVALLTTGSAFFVLGPLGLLSLVATAMLAVFIAFLVLVLRNILIIILIIMAPVAIVAYILPNTQKLWSIWWDGFSKALIMFPIIAAFIAAGHVFAAIATTQAQNQNGVTATISAITGFIAYFAPYFLIPLTLRFAGGVLGTIGGYANDRNRGMFDRLKKFRQDRGAYNMQRIRNNQRFNPNSGLGRVGNELGSWAVDPTSNALYQLRNRKGMPEFIRRGGQKVAGQIEGAQVEQTAKLFEEANKMGFNDKAWRALSGTYNPNSASASERAMAQKLADAGITGAPRTLTEMETIADVLATGNETEQIGANAIRANMGRLTTLYQDPEMGKASLQGAGILGLAAHGFADSGDLSTAANGLQSSMGTGAAQAITNQAQLMGARSRPETKNGYGVMYDQEKGIFVDGMKGNYDEATGKGIKSRSKAVLQTLNSQDLAGAKGGAFDAMESTISDSLAGPNQPGLTDDQKRSAQSEAKAVQDQLFSWAGPYSHASVDIKAKTLDYMQKNSRRIEREYVIRDEDGKARRADDGSALTERKMGWEEGSLMDEFDKYARSETNPETRGGGGPGPDEGAGGPGGGP